MILFHSVSAPSVSQGVVSHVGHNCRGMVVIRVPATLRGWRNTVEIVLFEISSSMKPYSSVFHAYTRELGPVIGFF